MDELLGFAVEQIAAAARKKNAGARPQGQAPASPDAQERYRQMLVQLQQRQLGQTPAAPPPVVQPPPSVARASSNPEPKQARQTAHDREEAASRQRSSGALDGFLEDGNSLLRAVVAAEVLSPPLALRENPLWQIRRPNEPST